MPDRNLFKTFLMACDLKEYVPAVKDSLFFFDKIYLNAEVEVAMEAASLLCSELAENLPTAFDAKDFVSAKLKKLPPNLQRKYQSNKAFQKQIDSKWGEQFLDVSNRIKKIEELLTPLAANASQIRNDLLPAIDAGFVECHVPPSKEQFAEDLKDVLTPAFSQMATEMFAHFFGQNMDTGRSDRFRLAIGARQAGLYSRMLNCPISSTRPEFLEFLNNFGRATDSELKAVVGPTDRMTWKAHFLAERVLEVEIPSLRDVPMDELVDVRKRVAKYISYFRREIFEVTEKFKSEVWDQQFEKELRYELVSKIRPKLDEAAHELEDDLERAFNAVAKAKASISASIIGYFTSVPDWLMLLLAAVVIEGTLTSFKQLKEKAIITNGYGFLIEVKKEVQRIK